MIRISVSPTAFEALAQTLPLGSVAYEKDLDERGECHVWLEPNVVDRLRPMRGQGESYSDVILRLIETSQPPQA